MSINNTTIMYNVTDNSKIIKQLRIIYKLCCMLYKQKLLANFLSIYMRCTNRITVF